MNCRGIRTAFYVFLLIGATVMRAQAQNPQSPAETSPGAANNSDCLGGLVKALKDKLASDNRDTALNGAHRVIQQWPVYVCEFTTDAVKSRLLTIAEEKRLDKQPGAPSNSSGSTSLVSKGSSPWLLGFALEHGGLTQTTDGNTVTFRGNVTNSIRALLDSTYLGSYQLKENDPMVQALAKLSFGVSFDASGSQTTASQGFSPSKNNFSGFSSKYEILNHRDPRDSRYRSKWSALAANQAASLASRIGSLDEVITVTHASAFGEWFSAVRQAIDNLPPGATEAQVRQVVEDAAKSFHDKFWELSDVKVSVAALTSGMSSFLESQDKTVDEIRGTPLITVEYNYNRQTTASGGSLAATQPNQTIPSLSNINLILEKGVSGGNTPEFTFNAAITFFNTSDLTNPKRGSVRDYRFSGELDLPLKPITNIGRPTLSFAGQFLSLREEPLGQAVTINGVTVSRTGNMGVFQTKLAIPIKDSGVKIPISFTYASRTELVKEKDVRGNIGITFDLDTLFSKAK